jgi:hypothetical protein
LIDNISYEIPICYVHSWFAFSPFHFPNILEFYKRKEGMVDDGQQVVLFRCWVLEDAHAIVATIDPLSELFACCHIFTLLLFAHQSLT